jgi:hypothetical protein
LARDLILTVRNGSVQTVRTQAAVLLNLLRYNLLGFDSLQDPLDLEICETALLFWSLPGCACARFCRDDHFLTDTSVTCFVIIVWCFSCRE